MIEPFVERQFIFNGSSVIPSQPGLRPSRENGAGIVQSDGGRHGCKRCPALIQQRNTAWRKSRRENGFDRIFAFLEAETRRCDCQKIVIYDGQVVTRCKAICRSDDVRFSPTYKLFSNFERCWTVVISRAEPADRGGWPSRLSIQPRQVEGALHLTMRIDSKVQSTRKLKGVGRIVEAFVTQERLANPMCPVIGPFLRINRSLDLQKATLRVVLSGISTRKKQYNQKGAAPHHDVRERASRVNVSSFIGRLY